MRWTLTIPGIDLGTLIPTDAELKPHDHPIEAWAGEVVGQFLQAGVTNNLMATMRAHTKPDADPVVQAAILRHLKLDHEILEYMAKNAKLTREELSGHTCRPSTSPRGSHSACGAA